MRSKLGATKCGNNTAIALILELGYKKSGSKTPALFSYIACIS